MKHRAKHLTAGLMSAMLFLTGIPNVSAGLPASAASDCVIDTATTYQTITGFGGINHPEWTGSDLSAAQRQTVFGNGENELGFTVLRIFVNPDRNQWNKALPTAQYASEHGVTVFASPWEPPSNLAESGGSNGKLHLPKSNYGAYAKHLNDFGTYMKQNGVDLYSISVQNEPDYAHDWTYWSTDEAVDFIANYGDQITSTRLMSPESFQYAPENASWVPDGGKKFYTKILNNQKAFANCDLFGTHFYGTTRDWMDFPALESCGKPIWMTEVYVPNSDANSNNIWSQAIQVSQNIHNGLVVGNMSAYVWWYIRRSYSPMSEDGSISKRGYCMAQYSKYVRPGAVRISCTESPAKDVQISAYQNTDGTIAIVAVNGGTETYTQSFTINSGETISDVTRYRTSETENLAKTAGMEASEHSFFASLPASSVSTFVVSGKVEANPDGSFFHDTFETFENPTDSWTGRGAATVSATNNSAYAGQQSLSVTGRTAAWNGAQKSLSTGIFKPGEKYSFSVDVCSASGTQDFMLSLQYTDASGETQYAHIAEGMGSEGGYVQLANPSFQIPAGASDLLLYVETADGTGSFFIDEAIGAVEGTKIDGPAPISFKLGDVNGDGNISAIDFTLAKRGMLKGFADASAKLAADVDQNGAVEMADLVWYVKYLTGQEKEFPEKVVIVSPTAPMRTISEYTPIVAANIVENEPDSAKQEKAGVAYGTIESGKYYSNFCGREKPYNVLLPAGYDSAKQYPVLYVLHGYWENQDRMIIKGNGTMYTRQIIGNAIAEGAAKDMIVVFPYIYSSQTQNDCSAMDDANNIAYDNFDTVLTTELMPLIESKYSVAKGRENTAITGFSMGGRESLNIGMKHPDLFGYVGAICPAPGASGAWKWESEEASPSLVLITAGANDTVVYTTPNGYHDNFTKNGVPHVWHYVNNGYHGDNSIHAHLYNFVRAVFQA